jgi:hypothetical protein
MIASAKELQKVQDEDISKAAGVVLDEVTKTMNSVENVLRGELNGSNNPRIRARIEFGKTSTSASKRTGTSATREQPRSRSPVESESIAYRQAAACARSTRSNRTMIAQRVRGGIRRVAIGATS